MSEQTAVIIGAGPAGLTAAYELVARTRIHPVVLEMSSYMGGIARTVNYKGNRIDIGGHRFFSKSDRVMDWWLKFLPLENTAGAPARIAYHRKERMIAPGADGAGGDRVMLLRERLSRIYFMRRFFAYPLKMNLDTALNLGLMRTAGMMLSYAQSRIRPIRPERTLEDFFINRFGNTLYRTFFKSYTEKVWGVPCNEISADWGAQRVKGLSISKALLHMLASALPARLAGKLHKKPETSLIERFLYPKYGPGQMWEEVAQSVTAQGGEILEGWTADRIEHDGERVTAIHAQHAGTSERRRFTADYFFSTMPVRELIDALEPEPPANVREVARGLLYRDFMIVGLLCTRLKINDGGNPARDTWIYIQESDVLVGRMQIFNNWSPGLVSDPSRFWIGMEYFCSQGDGLWERSDASMTELAICELGKLGFAAAGDVIDSTVIRMPKAYPAYFGAYSRFGEISRYTDRLENLFLIGRNGMHRYNNQDHSMLAAMMAVDNIVEGVRSRENLWALNTEMENHEERS